MPDMVPAFKGWRPPNLAISSIAGNLMDHDVYLADLILVRQKLTSVIKNILLTHKPELIGISAMSFQYHTARRIASFIKSLDSGIKIVLGGYHATLMYKEIGEEEVSGPFDFILRGESDLSFGEFVNALEKGTSYREVLGLSFREGGVFVHNQPRSLEDLTKIALPNRTNRIWKGYTFGVKQLDIIETSRGCTMPCNFCSMNHMYGRKFRAYAIERVIEDIANAKKEGAKYLAIADDNITLNTKRFEELCDAITKAGHNDIRYIVQTSCTGIASSNTLSEKMARAGFEFVFLGIENVSTRNLKMMKKGNILESIKRAVDLLHRHNMLIIGGMIIGNQEDREEDIAQNYEFFDKHNIDFISDQIITPYPKTPIREELLKADLVSNRDDYRKYNGFWANVRTQHLSSEELQFLKWKYKRKYSTFFKTTPSFKSRFPLVNLLRVLLLRPYFRIKDGTRSLRMSEREIFKEDMDNFDHLNDFRELDSKIHSFRNS